MSNVELLWREFFADPSQWWDKRKRKANPNAPDFKHKKTQKALWIDGPNNPGWVKFMLEEKCKADSQDDSGGLQLKWSMWEDYFTDPTMWWDNRMTKKNPRAPDFKHKVSKKMLRLDDSDNPEWVALRFANEQKMKTRDEIDPEVYSPHILACSPTMEPKKMEIKKSNHDSFVVELDVDRPKAKGKIDWEMLSAEHAVFLLEQLVEPPSVGSLITILEKCRIERSLVYARRAHTYVCKNDLIWHTKLGNYLVLMLVDCGGLHDAQQVFNGLNQKNEIAWSPLIHGYCECGDFEQALHLYEDMQDHHVQPSRQTLLNLLKACERLNHVEKGKEMHNWIVTLGYENGGLVGNLLVDMYAKLGLLSEAQGVLLGLRMRDVVAWTALIAGYAACGLGEEVWNCLERMHVEGVSPDAAAHICSLKAFSNAGAIDYGRHVHSQVIMGGFEEDLLIGNTLIDMYAKCGSLREAWEVFNKLSIQGVVSWTALIAGHARRGECEMVFELFEEMRFQGVSPNDTTFLIVLSVCSHAGMVEEGWLYFELMKNDYGIMPTINHHNCMLDLLCRSGQLNAAMLMLEKMPSTPNLVSWKTMLSACRKWGNFEIAKEAYELAVRKNMNQPSVMALMCDIFGGKS